MNVHHSTIDRSELIPSAETIHTSPLGKIVTVDEFTQLEAHPLAEAYPLMDGAEYESFREDIRINGLNEPIWLFEGKILDGRNCYCACGETGTPLRYAEFQGTHEQARAFVDSQNLHRRHLTRKQKREVVACKLRQNPELSDRAIAEEVKVHHSTVGAIRRLHEESGTIPKVTSRCGNDGKVRQPSTGQNSQLKPDLSQLPVKSANHPDNGQAPSSTPDVSQIDNLFDLTPDQLEALGFMEQRRVVEFISPRECRDVVASILRRLKIVQEQVSGLLAGPFAEEVRRAVGSSQEKWHDTGQMIVAGVWGRTRYGIRRYTCESLDGLLTFAGAAKVLLDRAKDKEKVRTTETTDPVSLGTELGPEPIEL